MFQGGFLELQNQQKATPAQFAGWVASPLRFGMWQQAKGGGILSERWKDQEDEEYHLVTPGKGSKKAGGGSILKQCGGWGCLPSSSSPCREKVQLVWEEKVAGFTLHTFSSDFKVPCAVADATYSCMDSSG